MHKDDFLLSDELKLKEKGEAISIGFIIGTFGHGRGGHFWDLKTISEKLNSKREVIVFNIGVGPSPVLDQANVKVVNLPLNAFIAFKKISEEIKRYNVYAIYSIDNRVDFISSIVCKSFKIPLIMIKPGGPNPRGFYPVMENLIVYSSENYKYFIENAEHSGKNVFFLPNRSSIVNINDKLVCKIKNLLPLDSFKFVQVIRITKDYYNNILQSIKLVKKLNLIQDVNVSLIVIGVVQDENIMSLLEKKSQGLPIYFFSNNEYTKSASELLSVGDAVIANGRSVMEASSLGLPILVSAKNTNIPVLLNNKIFDSAFSVNFSPRFELPLEALSERDNFDSIIQIVRDKEQLEHIKDFSKTCFNYNFNIDKVISDYVSIADNSKYKKMSYRSTFFMLKKYISSFVKTRLKVQ